MVIKNLTRLTFKCCLTKNFPKKFSSTQTRDNLSSSTILPTVVDAIYTQITLCIRSCLRANKLQLVQNIRSSADYAMKLMKFILTIPLNFSLLLRRNQFSTVNKFHVSHISWDVISNMWGKKRYKVWDRWCLIQRQSEKVRISSTLRMRLNQLKRTRNNKNNNWNSVCMNFTKRFMIV